MNKPSGPYYTGSQSNRIDFKVITFLTLLPFIWLIPIAIVLWPMFKLYEYLNDNFVDYRWQFRTWVWHHYRTWRGINDSGKVEKE